MASGDAAGQELLDQQRDVAAPLAQWRHDQVDDVEAVEQVLAERLLGDEIAQVLVGRGDDPDVHRGPHAIGSDLLQLAGFEEAQQQALHAQRHLADLVEEQRAAVGHLELPLLVAIGAGETALDVAEQLRLEQRLGQPGAVDGDEGPRRADAVGVYRARHQLLAGAALAGDQHLGFGAGGPSDLEAQLDDRRAVADELRVEPDDGGDRVPRLGTGGCGAHRTGTSNAPPTGEHAGRRFAPDREQKKGHSFLWLRPTLVLALA